MHCARLYLCTDLQRFILGESAADSVEQLDTARLEEFFRAAFRGGTDIIQVRDKKVSIRTELEALDVLVSVAGEEGGLSAANDRADVALLSGVDVFHVGQTDLTTEQVRRILGEDVLVGRSCHDNAQVRAASQDPGVDYYCTGPIWETPTKPGRAAVGLELPGFAARIGQSPDSSAKPFFAIGGVNTETAPLVRDAGAERIVVVRAVTTADDPEATARELRACFSPR
nr:thiamine phosphate synthase [Kocuria sp. 36]